MFIEWIHEYAQGNVDNDIITEGRCLDDFGRVTVDKILSLLPLMRNSIGKDLSNIWKALSPFALKQVCCYKATGQRIMAAKFPLYLLHENQTSSPFFTQSYKPPFSKPKTPHVRPDPWRGSRDHQLGLIDVLSFLLEDKNVYLRKSYLYL